MFLESICGRKSSYGWKSIQAGKELLTQRIRKKIGDGRATSVWYDPWLPTSPPRPAQGTILNPEIKICELWKTGHQRVWDEDKLASVLNREDVQIAKGIILSQYSANDYYIWPYSNDSTYTVKFGYWFATHVIEQEEASTTKWRFES